MGKNDKNGTSTHCIQGRGNTLQPETWGKQLCPEDDERFAIQGQPWDRRLSRHRKTTVLQNQSNARLWLKSSTGWMQHTR
jgi:hypothetical protein